MPKKKKKVFLKTLRLGQENSFAPSRVFDGIAVPFPNCNQKQKLRNSAMTNQWAVGNSESGRLDRDGASVAGLSATEPTRTDMRQVRLRHGPVWTLAA